MESQCLWCRKVMQNGHKLCSLTCKEQYAKQLPLPVVAEGEEPPAPPTRYSDMTPEEFRAIRKFLGMSQQEFGMRIALLGQGTVKDYESGRARIPHGIAEAARTMGRGEYLGPKNYPPPIDRQITISKIMELNKRMKEF